MVFFKITYHLSCQFNEITGEKNVNKKVNEMTGEDFNDLQYIRIIISDILFLKINFKAQFTNIKDYDDIIIKIFEKEIKSILIQNLLLNSEIVMKIINILGYRSYAVVLVAYFWTHMVFILAVLVSDWNPGLIHQEVKMKILKDN